MLLLLLGNINVVSIFDWLERSEELKLAHDETKSTIREMMFPVRKIVIVITFTFTVSTIIICESIFLRLSVWNIWKFRANRGAATLIFRSRRSSATMTVVVVVRTVIIIFVIIFHRWWITIAAW